MCTNIRVVQPSRLKTYRADEVSVIWNDFVSNSATPLTNEFVDKCRPTIGTVTTVIKKQITDWRSKACKMTREYYAQLDNHEDNDDDVDGERPTQRNLVKTSNRRAQQHDSQIDDDETDPSYDDDNPLMAIDDGGDEDDSMEFD